MSKSAQPGAAATDPQQPTTEDDDEAVGPADLAFDPTRLLAGDRVIVDFDQIGTTDRSGERVATLSRLELDPAVGDPYFKAVVPFEGDRNGGWECGGPLDAFRPVSNRPDHRSTD